jgi:hypothetical protein
LLQGEEIQLGKFTDAIVAANCYDKAAFAAHGANAVLNLPLDFSTSLALPGAQSDRPVVPLAKRRREEGPAATCSQPAGDADGNQASAPDTLALSREEGVSEVS